MNQKILLYSILGIGCVVLSFFIDWFFLIPAVVFMWLNQRELTKEKAAKTITKKSVKK